MTPPPSWVPTPQQLHSGAHVPQRPGVRRLLRRPPHRPTSSLSGSLGSAPLVLGTLFVVFLALLQNLPGPDLSLPRIHRLTGYTTGVIGGADAGKGGGGDETGGWNWHGGMTRRLQTFFNIPSSVLGLKGKEIRPPRALVVTAHPDDESMFFGPTILAFQEAGWELSALCLSTGNNDGLGSLRVPELISAYSLLGIPSSRVSYENTGDLQDGFTSIWPPQRIAAEVQRRLNARPADLIITFDGLGVSGHPNHVALSALPADLGSTGTGAGAGGGVPVPVPVLYLRSPGWKTKYTGWGRGLWVVLRECARLAEREGGAYLPWITRISSWADEAGTLLGLSRGKGRGSGRGGRRKEQAEVERVTGPPIVLISGLRQYVRTLRAMLQHKTQMVWFRWLYVGFSELMWVNELVPQAQSHP